MVGGAEEWCEAKPPSGPATAAEAGVVAAVLLLVDLNPALSVDGLAALIGRGFGSKGGRSIMPPPAGATRFTIWGVIICRF